MAQNIIVQPININEIQKALKDKEFPHVSKYQPNSEHISHEKTSLEKSQNNQVQIPINEDLLNNNKAINLEPDMSLDNNEAPKTLKQAAVKVKQPKTNKTKAKTSDPKIRTSKSRTKSNQINEDEMKILKRISEIKERLNVN